MPIEYRVKLRKTTESEVNVPVDLPTIFGDMPELSDKAIYEQAKSGALAASTLSGPLARIAGEATASLGSTTAVQVVSVHRGDVRVYPRPRKTAKDKPAQTAKEEAQDAPKPS